MRLHFHFFIMSGNIKKYFQEIRGKPPRTHLKIKLCQKALFAQKKQSENTMSLRPGSDAVLHMSRIEFELR